MDGTGKAGLGTEVMSGHIRPHFKVAGKKLKGLNCGSNFISKLQIKIILGSWWLICVVVVVVVWEYPRDLLTRRFLRTE